MLHTFCETLEQCRLYDLGYFDHDLTWENRLDGNKVAEEMLDHFYSSVERLLMFPDALIFHLDEDIFDHLPILIKIFARVRSIRVEEHILSLKICGCLRDAARKPLWRLGMEIDMVMLNLNSKIKSYSGKME